MKKHTWKRALSAMALFILTGALVSCASDNTGPGSGPYYSGDGGKGMRLAILVPGSQGLTSELSYLPSMVQGVLVTNISKYSAIAVLDRVSLDKIIAEQLDPTYKEDYDALILGNIAHVDYMMTGTITKTSAGYSIQLNVSGVSAEAKTKASYSKPCTVEELDNHSAIQNATAELLEQMGVTLTSRAKDVLMKPASLETVSAQTALAKGVTAQRTGSTVAALTYYTQAADLRTGLKEADQRLATLDRQIASGNIGENIRNDIQRRNAWKKLLDEAVEFYQSHPIVDLVLSDKPETRTNYRKGYKREIIEMGEVETLEEVETVTVDITFKITPVKNAAFDSMVKILMAMRDTKEMTEWGLSDYFAKLMFMTENRGGEASYYYCIRAELLDGDGNYLGRAPQSANGFVTKPVVYWDPSDRTLRKGLENVRFPGFSLTFEGVDPNKISDLMTVKFTFVGKTDAVWPGNSASVNGLANIRILEQKPAEKKRSFSWW